MKLATFNANSIRARLPILEDWLKTVAPDVLCIQETKVQDKDFPDAPFSDLGYDVTYKGQKKYNGVAILSKEPFTKICSNLDDEDDEEARFLRAETSNIVIINTYIPQGKDVDHPDFERKLRWFHRLLNHIDANLSANDDLIWMGDLNVAPTDDDVHDPDSVRESVCFHSREKEALQKVLDWGFIDIFRKHCPGRREFSFWDYRIPNGVKRDLGWRLDHILATPSLAERSQSCWIDKAPRLKERPSDHTFVVAEFEESS